MLICSKVGAITNTVTSQVVIHYFMNLGNSITGRYCIRNRNGRNFSTGFLFHESRQP